jgi:hypothetical protein
MGINEEEAVSTYIGQGRLHGEDDTGAEFKIMSDFL